jgi:hypothetical protein
MWPIEICRTIDALENIFKKHLPAYLPYYFQPMLPQLHHFLQAQVIQPFQHNDIDYNTSIECYV